MNSVAFTEIAGGTVEAALATNDVAPATHGAKATRTGTGVVRVDLNDPQDFGRLRIFVGTRAGPGVLDSYSVQVISATSFVITTFVITLVGGPALAITPTDLTLSFGVSTIPE